MVLSELYTYLDGISPFSSQEEWDNSGLLAGDGNSAVTGVVTCLDVTPREITLAKENGCSVIVSHHPVIFRPVKNVLKGSPVFDAVSSGISIISAHTCFDKAQGGVNDTLCSRLGMDYRKEDSSVAEGFLNTGTVAGCGTPEKLAAYIAEKLGASVRYVKGSDRVTKIAVCSGAGADFISDAAALGCDAFITGDASYHAFLDAASCGVSLFAAGHFETENHAAAVLADIISKQYPGLKIIVSDRKNPVVTVG